MGNERFLVVGATGQVGTQLTQQLSLRFGSSSVLGTSRSVASREEELRHLNLAEIQNGADVHKKLAGFDFAAVYCAGAMTHVDGCEGQPKLAHAINARGPQALAQYSAQLNIPFVYYSTEYVFPGTADQPGPYHEASPVRPLNVYGQSKLEGEQRVLDCCPGALVLRTTVVYGPDQQEKNFLYAVRHNLSQGVRMRIACDQVSTPTYSVDLVAATLGLVDSGHSGIFHVCGPELLDRLTFARQVAQHLGLDHSFLKGVSTDELKQTALRPLAAGLDTTKLRDCLPQIEMRTASEALPLCAKALSGSQVTR